MSGPVGLAYGNVRVRAMKSRLLGPDEALLLRSLTSVPALADALHIEPAGEPSAVARSLWTALLEDYRKLLDAFPGGRALLEALLGLHEIENLKLAWRARSRGLPADRWQPLWRSLGRLERMPLTVWSEAGSLRDAVARCAPTPYGAAAADALRSHGSDTQAAELALDRWAFERLSREAARLPRGERGAREIALALVRERDWDTLRRLNGAYRLEPKAALSVCVWIVREFPASDLERSLAWRPDRGPLRPHLPRRAVRGIARASDWDAFLSGLRRQRLAACRRALRGSVFRLAAPVAYAAMREAECRALEALAESLAGPPAPDALERAWAGSSLEAA